MGEELILNEIEVGQTKINLNSKSKEKALISFNVSEEENFNGKIVISDNALDFDNTHYFTFISGQKINIAKVTDQSGKEVPFTLTNNEININADQGVYFLTGTTHQGTNVVRKLVIQ